MSARPFIVPVFVPHADTGSWIDPPARLPEPALETWLHRMHGQVQGALASRADRALRAGRSPAPSKGSRGARAQLAFYGASFGALSGEARDAFLQGAKRWLDGGAIQSLRVTLDPLDAREPLLARLKDAGVETVELDAGSFDDEALAACGLRHRAADAVAAAERLVACGFELGIVLRPGMPGGTTAEIARTARRAAELAPSFVRIYPVLVLAGSRLAEAFESRRYRPLSLDEAVEIGKDLLPLFEDAGVAVGRIGFQPAVDLDGGAEVIAGPWHPSLRSLVEASLWFDRAARLIAGNFRFQRELTLIVAPVDESRMRGPQGANVRRLREKYRLSRLLVRVDDDVAAGSLALEMVEGEGHDRVRRAG